ncbi:DUF805 domain-containing protein [Vallitalea pronyensis]|uniref:DUF805 domain-containing protein n=1 Tax=Vallitalea pronyensis TaxID=1348613 RepID=A0A8J8ML52_9FIRM|nr:DUF805 domain-containing protein [Vallitalea pronyensis]
MICIIMLSVKRLHDFSKTGWLILAYFMPITPIF